ncbi:DeoR/GlpR family DNA-binding transcription regulator [Mobiluncus mulieris]|uniref:DeoR/GlpR family DNA-binding transcription regulator n=2 Tax=Mobiluncus mulieris TaxID=2052 RepID=UPI00201668C9|nr:DeoR/GlpR family DNA-binding transcription regulator [Mobiluncus mulieris]
MKTVEVAMPVTNLDPESRRRKIVAVVTREGSCHIDDLAQMFQVSAMTVYRDIADLEHLQLVTLRRGEVQAAQTSLSEAAATVRLGAKSDLKHRLSDRARSYLRRGQSIMVDDSSSTVPLISDLADLCPITVATNAEFVAQRLRLQEGVKLLLLGGEYESWAEAYFGELTEASISRLQVDWLIMSVSAITDGYCYHPQENVARTKRQMIAAARQRILVADCSKFSRAALYKIGSLTDFDIVITDAQTPPEIVADMRKSGLQVDVV